MLNTNFYSPFIKNLKKNISEDIKNYIYEGIKVRWYRHTYTGTKVHGYNGMDK